MCGGIGTVTYSHFVIGVSPLARAGWTGVSGLSPRCCRAGSGQRGRLVEAGVVDLGGEVEPQRPPLGIVRRLHLLVAGIGTGTGAGVEDRTPGLQLVDQVMGGVSVKLHGLSPPFATVPPVRSA